MYSQQFIKHYDTIASLVLLYKQQFIQSHDTIAILVHICAPYEVHIMIKPPKDSFFQLVYIFQLVYNLSDT